ncbi:MAG: 50S ribosome-binding GTPase [Candidatus Lokiarchaeota archaeon]|nr:50S ribosome-binding GTPase [Candidatus Lokiarchaeota archaeon]
MEKQEKQDKKKIILVGIDKAGKTSIVQSLQGIRNLTAFNSLVPTREFNSIKFQAMGLNYLILDLGGQESYRFRHLEKFEEHILEASKIIYVIDILDRNRYNLSLEYLEKIIDKLKNIPINVEISIFFHKYDPDLEPKIEELAQKSMKELIERIKVIIPNNFNYSIFKTSIYTIFEKSKID